MTTVSNAPRAARTVLAAAVLATTLTGCFPLVMGGAAVMGSMVAVDRRTSGAQLEDEGIELRAASRLREAFGGTVRVNVTSYNRQVLLTGEVPSAAARQQAEQVVQRVDNVRAVVNALDVTASPSFNQRSADTVITGRVKASLIDAKDLQASAFKVVTERNVVYLLGRVTQREATRATDIARGIGGVEKVVRVLEVVSEQELAGGAPPAPAPAQAAPASAPAPAASTVVPATVAPAPAAPVATPLAPLPAARN